MESTLYALMEHGSHEDVERHLLSRGNVPPVAVAVIRHLREVSSVHVLVASTGTVRASSDA